MTGGNQMMTLCICAYNASSYIEATLESLSRQTLRNFRLLVIDDCSIDDTVQKVRRFFLAHNWENTEIVALPENHGTAYVRNLALHKADTPLMMFFDADDVAKPEMIEKLYTKLASDENLIAVGCFCNYMDAKGNPLPGGLFLGPQGKEEFLLKAQAGKMMFFTPPTLFRREYAIRAGGYRQAGWFPTGPIRYEDLSEDVDLWGRMSDFFAEGKAMITLPEVLFLYRKNTNSLSTGFAKARAMGQKMMYIKANQLRRRACLPELRFDEYWRTLGHWKKFQFERRNFGAFLYREACFAYVQRNLIRCGIRLLGGMLCAPGYPVEKYKANFCKKKK